MKTILRVSFLACLLAVNLSAQSNWEETKATPTRPWLFGESRFASPRFDRPTHVGIFPVFGDFKERRAAHLLSHFLPSRQHRPASARPQLFSLFGDPYGSFGYSRRSLYRGSGYGSPYYHIPQFQQGTELYNSQRFVEEWKNREPRPDVLPSSPDADLRGSTVLTAGMTEEQVLGVVGSPLEKISLGERSVWKYSGYSLLFEDGRLKEIR